MLFWMIIQARSRISNYQPLIIPSQNSIMITIPSCESWFRQPPLRTKHPRHYERPEPLESNRIQTAFTTISGSARILMSTPAAGSNIRLETLFHELDKLFSTLSMITFWLRKVFTSILLMEPRSSPGPPPSFQVKVNLVSFIMESLLDELLLQRETPAAESYTNFRFMLSVWIVRSCWGYPVKVTGW